MQTSFAVAVIAALSIAGCGDDSTGSDTPADPSVVTTTTVSPAAGGADPGPGAGGGAPGNGDAGGNAPSGGGSNSGDGTQDGPGEGNSVGK